MATTQLKGLTKPKESSSELFTVPKITPVKVIAPKSTKLFGTPKFKTPGQLKAEQVKNEIIKTRPISSALKGTQSVIPGDPRFAQYYAYNQFGQISTQLDLSDPNLRIAVLQKAEEAGQIPKGTVAGLQAPEVQWWQRLLNLPYIASAWEGVVGSAYRAVVKPSMEGMAAGIKEGKPALQAQREQTLPMLGRALVSPILWGVEFIKKIANDLEGVFGSGIRKENFDPYTLAIDDAKAIQDALRAKTNKTAEDTNFYDGLTTLINFHESPFAPDWVKQIPVVGSALIYPMFRTWGNVIDLAGYIFGDVVASGGMSASGAIGGGMKIGVPFTKLQTTLRLPFGMYIPNPVTDFLKSAFKSTSVFKYTYNAAETMNDFTGFISSSVKTFKQAKEVLTRLESPYFEMATKENWLEQLAKEMTRQSQRLSPTVTDMAEIVARDFQTWGGRLSVEKAMEVKRLEAMTKESAGAGITAQTLKTLGYDIAPGTMSGFMVKITDEGAALYRNLKADYENLKKNIFELVKKEKREVISIDEAVELHKANPSIKMAEAIRANPSLYLYNASRNLLPLGRSAAIRMGLAEYDQNLFQMGLADTLLYFPRALAAALGGEGGVISSIFKRRFGRFADTTVPGIEEYYARNFNLSREKIIVYAAYGPDIEKILENLKNTMTPGLQERAREQILNLIEKAKKGKISSPGLANLNPELVTKTNSLIMFYENQKFLAQYIASDVEAQNYMRVINMEIKPLITKIRNKYEVSIDPFVEAYMPHVFTVNPRGPFVGAAIYRMGDKFHDALAANIRFLENPVEAWRSQFRSYLDSAAMSNIGERAFAMYRNTANMILGSPRIFASISENKTLSKGIVPLILRDLEDLINTSTSAAERLAIIDIFKELKIPAKISKDGLIKLTIKGTQLTLRDFLRLELKLTGKYPGLSSIFPYLSASDDKVLGFLMKQLYKANKDVYFQSAVRGLNPIQQKFFVLSYFADMPLPRQGTPGFLGYDSMKQLVELGGKKGVEAFATTPAIMLTTGARELGLIDNDVALVVGADKILRELSGITDTTRGEREVTAELLKNLTSKKGEVQYRLANNGVPLPQQYPLILKTARTLPEGVDVGKVQVESLLKKYMGQMSPYERRVYKDLLDIWPEKQETVAYEDFLSMLQDELYPLTTKFPQPQKTHGTTFEERMQPLFNLGSHVKTIAEEEYGDTVKYTSEARAVTHMGNTTTWTGGIDATYYELIYEGPFKFISQHFFESISDHYFGHVRYFDYTGLPLDKITGELRLDLIQKDGSVLIPDEIVNNISGDGKLRVFEEIQTDFSQNLAPGDNDMRSTLLKLFNMVSEVKPDGKLTGVIPNLELTVKQLTDQVFLNLGRDNIASLYDKDEYMIGLMESIPNNLTREYSELQNKIRESTQRIKKITNDLFYGDKEAMLNEQIDLQVYSNQIINVKDQIEKALKPVIEKDVRLGWRAMGYKSSEMARARMIKESLKMAARDGINEVLMPTGRTASHIEGWSNFEPNSQLYQVPKNIKFYNLNKDIFSQVEAAKQLDVTTLEPVDVTAMKPGDLFVSKDEYSSNANQVVMYVGANSDHPEFIKGIFMTERLFNFRNNMTRSIYGKAADMLYAIKFNGPGWLNDARWADFRETMDNYLNAQVVNTINQKILFLLPSKDLTLLISDIKAGMKEKLETLTIQTFASTDFLDTFREHRRMIGLFNAKSFADLRDRMIEDFGKNIDLGMKEAKKKFIELKKANVGKEAEMYEYLKENASGLDVRIFDYTPSNPGVKIYNKEPPRVLKQMGAVQKIWNNPTTNHEWFRAKVLDKWAADYLDAFRLAQDDMAVKAIGPKLTPWQKKNLINLNVKWFGDKNLEIVNNMEKYMGRLILGSHRDGMIKILNGQAVATDSFYHEVVHKFLNIFSTSSERNTLLGHIQSQFKLQGGLKEAEEILAEEFIKYAKSRSGFVGGARLIVDRVLNRIRKFFGHEDEWTKFYTDIMSGKAKKLEAQAGEGLTQFKEAVAKEGKPTTLPYSGATSYIEPNLVKSFDKTYQAGLRGVKMLIVNFNPRLPVTSAIGNMFNDAFLFGGSGMRNFPEILTIFKLTTNAVGIIPGRLSWANKVWTKLFGFKNLTREEILLDPLYLALSPNGKKVVQLLLDSPNTKASLTTDWMTRMEEGGAGFDTMDALDGLAKKTIPGTTNTIASTARKMKNWFASDPFGFGFTNTAGDYLHKISGGFKMIEDYPDYYQALENYNKYFTAFADLPPFEQFIHKRVFQFYLWQRNNFMNYVKALFKDPRILTSFAVWGKSIRLAQSPEILDAISKLPDGDYRKNLLWVGTPDSFIMGLNTPFESFTNFSRMISFIRPGTPVIDSMRDSANAIAENLNIPLSMAVALATNYDTRTHRFINPGLSMDIKSTTEGFSRASDFTKNLMLMMPEAVREHFGFIKSENPYTKQTEYFIDPYLNWAINRFPMAVFTDAVGLLNIPEDTSITKTTTDDLIRYFTGYRAKGIRDLEIINRLSDKSLNDRLGKLLVEAGLMNINELPSMTALQKMTIGLPQTVEQQGLAQQYAASPLSYTTFQEQQQAAKKSASQAKAALQKTKSLFQNSSK
jgi:hypothetical protein